MITEQVGNRIRALRKQRGLSQEKLALKAGIDRTYLAGIETGKRNATLLSLEKVAIALDISIQRFRHNAACLQTERHSVLWYRC